MNLKKEQAYKYMDEAELTLESAQAIFEKAKKENKDFWANVVKNCYDSIEQDISSTIANKEENIPIKHPDKIDKFSKLYNISEELDEKIFFWLRKRASAHYVDIKNLELLAPHELFTEEDAKRALNESRNESRVIIDEIKKLIKEAE